jgi:predicted metal-dependent hydrolase
MASQVVQLKHIGNVTFSQNKRSKNIKLSVKADKSVLVSFPFYISSKEALTFVLKNEDWIRLQQEKMNLRKTKIKPNSVLKTKLHTVSFVVGEDNKIRKKGNEIEIIVSDIESDEALDFIDIHLTAIYRYEAKRLLPVRLSELARKHNFNFNKVSIRNNRRNWGSCSSKNNISLNLQMMKLPVELIDYILLHELVHTEIKNHGTKFWDKLNQVSNNRAKELAREVKKYSTYTL